MRQDWQGSKRSESQRRHKTASGQTRYSISSTSTRLAATLIKMESFALMPRIKDIPFDVQDGCNSPCVAIILLSILGFFYETFSHCLSCIDPNLMFDVKLQLQAVSLVPRHQSGIYIGACELRFFMHSSCDACNHLAYQACPQGVQWGLVNFFFIYLFFSLT